MDWNSIQQIIRIVLYALGGYLLGDGVTQGELFQGAVGGVISVASFLWWLYWNRNTPKP